MISLTQNIRTIIEKCKLFYTCKHVAYLMEKYQSNKNLEILK
jgi:hypothetical protein